jgi:hypothetical protein
MSCRKHHQRATRQSAAGLQPAVGSYELTRTSSLLPTSSQPASSIEHPASFRSYLLLGIWRFSGAWMLDVGAFLSP